eukprot:CAMPEP_0172442062 /NCGR_PEP_ID=MMETSP1065-20121228/2527_1 /TAXON_ID=265537 /ORGANISM="Amphiprora paludosa, Strain CCMP125" /LENGTH=744 /DNA_ID=CAMNT_0013191739 /DNA_START=420 /DNA_END=2654 /DNA_ORIENTATION=-
MATNKRASDYGRSVVDYVSESDLKSALETVTPQGQAETDWMLPMSDPTAEKQTQEGELQRLLNLKSFMLLDAEKEEAFDKLTQEAKEIFGVPTSLISLIDFGRQFFLSKAGSEATETTRAASFCGYTIQNKEGLLVVPDAKKDNRFKDGELVNSGPKTRFYAGAALVSPEGEKLGAFCLNGSEPRPQGLNDMEKDKLKEYAAKTMEIMVERRKRLRDTLSADNINVELRNHAAVATSLGDILYMEHDLYTAMRLYQESVQTIMYEEGKGQAKVPKDRQETMLNLLSQLSQDNISQVEKTKLMSQVVAMFEKENGQTVPVDGVVDGISGLFHLRPTMRNASTRVLPGLVFSDVFKIDMRPIFASVKQDKTPLEELDFTVPIEECTKATLFNMGQIQYHWQNQETAMQFFHLAASVSHKISPLAFDPVDISCINNMAQIHLQCGQPEDALKMLREALDRGSKTLAAMYRHSEAEHGDEEHVVSMNVEEKDAYRTHRLRRKLARTLINISHVLFHKADYEGAMASLRDAVPLIDRRTMTGRSLSAIWYNMSLILHRQGKSSLSLAYMNKFLEASLKLNLPDHLQTGDGMHHKAVLLFEAGKIDEAMEPINEAIRLRIMHVGEKSSCVAESEELKGKLLLAQQKYDEALGCMTKTLSLGGGGEMNLEVAQTMLDMGRAYHSKGDTRAALATYAKVLEWARSFFGPNHAFVARIAGIVAAIQPQAGVMGERPNKRFKDGQQALSGLAAS